MLALIDRFGYGREKLFPIMKSQFETPISLNYANEVTTIAKGAGIVLVGTVFFVGALYLFNIYIARVLGPGNYGLYSIGWAIFNILSIFALVGMDNGMVRFVSLYKGENNLSKVKGTILFGLFVVILISIIISILIILLADKIAVSIFQKGDLSIVFQLFGISLPFFTVMTVFTSSFQGLKHMRYFVSVKNIIEPMIRFVAVTLLFIAGLKLEGALIAHLSAYILSAYLGYIFLKKIFPLFRTSIKATFEPKKLLAFSIPLLFVSFLQTGLIRSDKLLLGYFRSSEEVGIYTAAFQTAMLILMILQSFNTIFAPIISDLYNRSERIKLEFLFKAVTKWVFTLSLPLSFMFFFFSDEILMVFGEEFLLGSTCLKILAISHLINTATGSVGYLLIMSGHQNIEFFNNLGTLLLEIVLCSIYIPKHGILGAAIATGISFSLVNILKLAEVYLILKIHPYRIDFLKPMIAGLIALITLFLVNAFSIQTNQVYLVPLVKIVFFAVFYCVGLYLLRISEEDKIILKHLISRVRLRKEK